MILEKLSGNGPVDVEKLYEMAQMADFDIIKLGWKQLGFAIAELYGFEVPNLVQGANRFNVLSDEVSDSVEFSIGTVVFYPDLNGVRWGYVTSTPENIRLIAENMASGLFVVRSREYKETIEKKCSELGLRSKAYETKHESIVVSETEKKAELKAKRAEDELIEARKRLAEFEQKTSELEEEVARAKLASVPATVPAPATKDDLDDDGDGDLLNPVFDPLGAGAQMLTPPNGSRTRGRKQ